MSKIFLDPTNEVAFKKLFAAPENKLLLKDFISSLLFYCIDDNQIEDLKYVNPSQDCEIAPFKSIIDVVCKTDKGNKIPVEIHLYPYETFLWSAVDHSRQACTNRAKVTNGINDDLQKVIFLALCNFSFFSSEDFQRRRCGPENLGISYESRFRYISFIFVEIPKINLEISQLKCAQQVWFYFLRNGADTTTYQMQEMARLHPPITEAYASIRKLNWSKEDLNLYDLKAKEVNDVKDTEEERIKSMWSEVKTESIYVVRNEIIWILLTKTKLSVDKIAEITDLSVDQINRLIEFCRLDRPS